MPFERPTRQLPDALPTAPPWVIVKSLPAGPRVIVDAPETSSVTGTRALPAELDTAMEPV